MKKRLTWFAIYCMVWAAIYAAFAAGSEGALHLLKFYAWASAIVSPVLLVPSVQANSAAEPESSVFRRVLGQLQAWTLLLLFVWFGHPATAVACCLSMLLFAVHRDKVRELRAAPKAAEGGAA